MMAYTGGRNGATTLHMGHNPPVLECPPPPKSCQQGRKWNKGGGIGEVWSSMRSFFSAPPTVTWVNPAAVQESAAFYTLSSQLPPHQGPPMEKFNPYLPPPPSQVDGLWFPAPPSNYDLMDPLLMWSDICIPGPAPHPGPKKSHSFDYCSSPAPVPSQKKPLNPLAKEWVPPGYSCTPPQATQQPLSFCEITQEEVEAVRSGDNKLSSKYGDSAATIQHTPPPDTGQQHLKICLIPVGEESTSDPRPEQQVLLGKATKSEHIVVSGSDKCGDEAKETLPQNVIDGAELLTESSRTATSLVGEDSSVAQCEGSGGGESYASVVGRPSPSPPPSCQPSRTVSPGLRGVEQPLPKIFVKDKVYPKEKAAGALEGTRKAPLPFRTVSSTQKKCSREFLRQLRQSSPITCRSEAGSDVESSSCASSADFPPGSPRSAGGPGLGRTASESSSCDSHARTLSECSADSIDIEFLDNPAPAQPPNPCTPLSQPAKVPAHTNSFLACILGSCEDSEEEEEEEDEDEDWEDDWGEPGSMTILDDSWETFGFGLVVVEEKQQCVPNTPAVCADPSLEQVNRRWEEQVMQGVKPSSGGQVRFGGHTVHPMVAWAHAYRAARKGPWEQLARDRERFRQRVASLEPLLTPVLQPAHRTAAYLRHC